MVCIKQQHASAYSNTMADYSKGKIYSIRSRSRPDLIYIGSTVQTLAQRMGVHVSTFKHRGMNMNESSKFVLEIGDAYIELIEACPCATKDELHRREGQIQRATACVNMNIAGRTPAEYRQDNAEYLAERSKDYHRANAEYFAERHKDYRMANAEYLAERSKEWYEENKERILGLRKQNYEADPRPKIEYQKKYALAHRDEILEKHKTYRDEHKDQYRAYCESHKEDIAAMRKQYAVDHRDHIRARGRERYRAKVEARVAQLVESALSASSVPSSQSEPESSLSPDT
jgi:hypothetical protein